jgi:hydroxymethyl cephem carbamoyltransferase
LAAASGSRGAKRQMLVLAVKSGHDGSVAAVEDGRLLFSLEGEKDSCKRYLAAQPTTVLDLAEQLGGVPDVIALSGWPKPGKIGKIGGGYGGVEPGTQRQSEFFGKRVTFFSDSHERSHILGTIGMAPRDDAPLRAVLIWEGILGSLYLVDETWTVTRAIPVMHRPGHRYSHLFGLADPAIPDHVIDVRYDVAGKLMALAGFGRSADADPRLVETVEILLAPGRPPVKGTFKDSPVYNAGVEAQVTKDAAALLTDRLFEVFADAARVNIPEGLPLYIGGGCGLNCDWNARWRDLGYFSSVFVPPCANDSGSAIGTAIDAQAALTGDPHIDWSVYSGLEFDHNAEPDPARWQRVPLSERGVAEALAQGRVFAWVQGRWEIGPRALGNRSLLADASDARMKERLNQIKQREDYRPIAPCCRLEDLPKAFVDDFEDPYMLYFNRVRTDDFGAVTHVDGSARVQTVSAATNERLHRLLDAVAERRGLGVLCNTSLNFKGYGFINRMSDLINYCDEQGVDEMVVGDAWYRPVSADR